MRRSRSNALLGIAIASWLTIACTSGIGPLANYDDPYDQAPNSRENPGPGRESPGPGRESPGPGFEAPPESTDNPGSHGGGPGSGTAKTACPPCDQKFTCLIVSGTKSENDTIELKTKNGACTIEGTIIVECGGKLTLNGQSVGAWQASGSGFTATVTTSKGTGTLTCVPRLTTPPPSTTTTAVPPGTTTSPPPIIDSGVRDTGADTRG